MKTKIEYIAIIEGPAMQIRYVSIWASSPREAYNYAQDMLGPGDFAVRGVVESEDA